MQDRQDLTTHLIHHPYTPPPGFAAPQPGVFKASTVIFPNVAALRSREWKDKSGYTYGLHGTPTTFTLEERLCTLEGGLHCLLVPSGLAAISTVGLALLQPGDEVLIPDNAYGPNKEFARGELARFGVRYRLYDPLDAADLAAQITPATRLVWLEAPGSVSMEFPDLPALVRICRAQGVCCALDNTWGAGLAFAPFDLLRDGGSLGACRTLGGDSENAPQRGQFLPDSPPHSGAMGQEDGEKWAAAAHSQPTIPKSDRLLGADISIHALTKYPSGGGDVLMGSIVTRDAALHQRLQRTHMHLGLGVGANDAEAVLRALPSLALRYRAHDVAARTLARWLAQQSQVVQVLHPALPGAPGHAHWRALCAGASGVVQDATKEVATSADPGLAAGLFSIIFDARYRAEQVDAFCDALRLFKIGYSWGGPISLVVPYELAAMRSRAAPHLQPGHLVRFSIGLEAVADLQRDLQQALAQALPPL
ncbi:PLP-dependent transferase [Extensimonas sp. H3M7-6]|nr:PLP-dependent transferase [Extensimonas sp. H3M7-6]MDF1481493.1 PLP-dependent transferase [Extensimonas sp. H3M7-6]